MSTINVLDELVDDVIGRRELVAGEAERQADIVAALHVLLRIVLPRSGNGRDRFGRADVVHREIDGSKAVAFGVRLRLK